MIGCVGGEGGRFAFRVWAPKAKSVAIRVEEAGGRDFPMEPETDGYWHARLEIPPGTRYRYVQNDTEVWPDPASRFQPEGVHGPSACTDLGAFEWQCNDWSGMPLDRLIFYELHIGTFTGEGTFDAAIDKLDHLLELGITAVEIMPVAEFPGERNWGYDGVYPFATQASYGGPSGLMRLVDACHERGLAVCLDVVYNHLGPEGNYLWAYGPYFTDRYKTPWGSAINFDGDGSDPVREYFIENALQWLRDFRIDVLRLDATHAIVDESSYPFLEELADRVRMLSELEGIPRFLIAESDANTPRLMQPQQIGGMGLSGQWNDEFHHAIHALLTGERDGYYADYGTTDDLAKAFRTGYVYTGQKSEYRGRRHGRLPNACLASQFVVCIQNHDQVGNRAVGDRLSTLISYEKLKQAAALMLLSPFVPMLFMGEEWGESNPFLYFTSHGDAELVKNVRKGRAEEFAAFAKQGELADPQDPETFERSRLNWAFENDERKNALYEFYREAIRLRQELAPLSHLSFAGTEAVVTVGRKCLVLRRKHDGDECVALFNFSEETIELTISYHVKVYRKCLDSSETRWLGSGSSREIVDVGDSVKLAPNSCVLYERIDP